MERETIRVLLLEDDQSDVDLLERELRKDPESQFDVTHVGNEAEFRAALGPGWDVILSDYRLPGFNAKAALRLVAEAGLEIPFVVVSGRVGDESAAELIRDGVADFVTKDRLGRLPRALSRCVACQRCGIRHDRRLTVSEVALQRSLTHNEMLDLHLQELDRRRAYAVELNDNALQSLVVAQTALASRDVDLATEAVRRAFDGVQQVLARLVPEHLAPGDLRRNAPAGGGTR